MSIGKVNTGTPFSRPSDSGKAPSPKESEGVKKESSPFSIDIDLSAYSQEVPEGATSSIAEEIKETVEDSDAEFLSEVRAQEIKERIESGFYETPEVIDKIIDSYLREYVLTLPNVP